MFSPLFGVEALAREPKGFGEQQTSQEEPDRIVRAVRPDVTDRLTVEALSTRDERARAPAPSPDDVAAA